MKRCPNGSRRNKSSKKCEPKNKSIAKKSTSSKCSKGVEMPPHRIKNIIKFEKQMASILEHKPEPEFYERMEKYLEGLCFPRDTNWANVGSFSLAICKAKEV
jgi:hypothetical protein